MSRPVYSRKDVIDAFRADNPDAAHIDDNKIFAAIAVEDPDLVRGVSELEPRAFESPRYGPTGATAGQVAYDQAANVLTGIPQAITGIPGMVKEAAGLGVDALSGNAMGTLDRAKRIVGGMAQPFTTTARGVGALVAPGSVQAPSDEDWAQAAQGAGAQLGAAALPNVVSGIPPAARTIGRGARTITRSVVDPRGLLTRAQRLRTAAEGPRPRADLSDVAAPITGGVVGGVLTANPVGAAAGAAAAESVNRLRHAPTYLKGKANLYEKAANLLLTPEERLRTTRSQAMAAADEQSRMAQIANEPPPVLPGREIASRRLDIQPPGVSPTNQQFLSELRQALPPAGPDLALIEKGLAPTASRAKAVQMFNADGTPTSFGRQLPELVPEIINVPPGPKFDSGLMKGLRRMEEGINAADDLVPPETVIDGAPIREGLQALADEAASYGNKRLANALQQKVDVWAKLGDSIPWSKFRDAKRAFFREKNADINSATMRRAYGVLMEASESVGGDIGQTLKTANSRYSVVRKAIDAAGIDPVTGRRPGKSVGKVERARAIQQSAVTGDDAVLQAISELGGESGNPVGIAALRDRLPNLTKQQLDSAIERLSQDKIHVSRQDHPIDDPAEMARSRASGKWVAVSLRR